MRNQWFSSYQSDLDRENDGEPARGLKNWLINIFHSRIFPRFLIRTPDPAPLPPCLVLGLNIEHACYKKCPWCQFPASRPPQYSVFQIGLNLHDNRGVLDPSRYFCSITEPARHWDYLANCRNLSFHVANRSQRLNWYLLPSNTLNSRQCWVGLVSPRLRKTGDLADHRATAMQWSGLVHSLSSHV